MQPLRGGALFIEAEDESLMNEWSEKDPYILTQLAEKWEWHEIGQLAAKLPFELTAKRFDYD